MNRLKQTVNLTLLAILVALPLVAWAGDDAAEEAWMQAMAPGDPHTDLATQAGEWSYIVTLWREPGAEPISLEGVATKTMIMGGRFLREELNGAFDERPQGFGVTGYDRRSDVHVDDARPADRT